MWQAAARLKVAVFGAEILEATPAVHGQRIPLPPPSPSYSPPPSPIATAPPPAPDPDEVQARVDREHAAAMGDLRDALNAEIRSLAVAPPPPTATLRDRDANSLQSAAPVQNNGGTTPSAAPPPFPSELIHLLRDLHNRDQLRPQWGPFATPRGHKEYCPLHSLCQLCTLF